MSFYVNNKSPKTIYFNNQPVKSVYYNGVFVWGNTDEIDGVYALKFSSPESFSVEVSSPGWNGTMYYSTDTKTWNTWDGSNVAAVTSGNEYKIYFRGVGNDRITGNSLPYNGQDSSRSRKWTLNGYDISCIGNIDTLLDYTLVENGEEPVKQIFCYANMFNGCEGLVVAPKLPAKDLSYWCYYYMFSGCGSLVAAPALPAQQIGSSCYEGMFDYCYSLTQIPALPEDSTFGNYCCQYMFEGCSSLKFSETQTEECPNPYPIYGAYSSMGSFNYMFSGTRGSFSGTPTLNTTYYTNATVV